MDMKKTAKKISALVAGATMIGATIMGASADLGSYPAPFVTNGVFNGKIVVGERAATSDVVGAIDLAASLQAEATSSSEVNVPGAAGEAAVDGDSAEFRTGSDVVAFEESIGSVKQTFTSTDLDALQSGVLSTGSSSTPVKQYLKFDNTTSKVVYEEDTDEDQLGDFLKITDGQTVFEYQLEFTEGAESDIDSGDLEDLENEVLTILGAPFTISDASRSAGEVSLELLGGQVADVLRDGETKTYTIDGVDYEVTAVFISDASPASAKISVNGVITKELEEGETEVLGEDVTVGVQSILTNQREGLVEFYLGANKIVLTDPNHEDTAYTTSGTVEVDEETVDNSQLIIKATNVSSTALKLNYVKYKVLADDDHYIAPGESVRAEVEDENEGAFLTNTWDILYAGLVQAATNDISINAVSDHSYEVTFTNLDGDEYNFPYLTNENGALWGDEDDRFVFVEAKNSTTWQSSSTSVADNDYFIVSDKAANTDDKARTRVLRYQSLNTGDNTVTFKDLSGDDIVVSYTGTLGTSAQGDLIVDGVTHLFYIGSDEELSIDLDGDGSVTQGDEVTAVAMGGAILDFGTQAWNATLFNGWNATGTSQVFSVITDQAMFDEPTADETSTVTVSLATSTEVHISAATVDLGGSTNDLESDPNNDELETGYSGYGAFFSLSDPDTTSDAEELTVEYPETQRYAQVFVTAGVVEVAEGAAGESGRLMTSRVNPIAVGLAVLDSEAPALGSTNMIVVGGPCVNTVAAELMGNPVDCAEGFTPGKAVIKLFESRKALLVAGYSAQDTLGATYVLADSDDYDLSGDEVEVVVADLQNIDINVVE
jgi:hypothetical protein